MFNSVEILPFRIYSIVLSLECVNYMALEISENRRVNIQNAPRFKEYISRHFAWTWFLETLNHQNKIKKIFLNKSTEVLLETKMIKNSSGRGSFWSYFQWKLFKNQVAKYGLAVTQINQNYGQFCKLSVDLFYGL